MGVVGYIKDRYKETNLRLKYLTYGRRIPSRFGGILIPILRRVLPSILATEIIGVQPMSEPAGQVFTLKHRYGLYGILDSEENIHYHWGRELRNTKNKFIGILLS